MESVRLEVGLFRCESGEVRLVARTSDPATIEAVAARVGAELAATVRGLRGQPIALVPEDSDRG